MSYAADLAKDRDKYRAQCGKFAQHIRELLDKPRSVRAADEARKAIEKYELAECRAADHILKTVGL